MVSLPTILVPPMVVWTTGITSASSASNVEKKFAEPVDIEARQYELVNVANTPMSEDDSNRHLTAISVVLAGATLRSRRERSGKKSWVQDDREGRMHLLCEKAQRAKPTAML